MKASINRITIVVLALLPVLATAQSFPPSVFQAKELPNSHSKQKPSTKALPNPSTSKQSQRPQPVCAFDEMNEAHRHADPVFAKELKNYLEEAVPKLAGHAGEKSAVEPLLTISVVVHVIHNGEPVGQGQNISDAQVLEQIAILNEDYASLNGQFYNTPSQWMGIAGFPNIQFCLANKKPDGSATNGIDRRQFTVTGTSWNNNNVNSTIKPATNWNPNKYFNIYVLPIPGTTAQGGVVGYSNYPIPGQIGGSTDGVVIDYRWFGGPSFPVSGYRPLTHETGHYLGLPHPFNGNSCSLDDGISDTPNVDGPTRDKAALDCDESFPGGPMSCGNEHMYVNYMDYVTENCYTSFSAGQVNVMRSVLNGTSSGFGYGSRHDLLVFAPQQCNIPATDAGVTRVVSPNNVTCTNGNQLTPIVSLRNFGTNDLTAATIHYKVNNGATVSYNWQGSLFPGENEEVALAPFTVNNGAYSITTWTTSPNGQTDQRIANDTVVANRFNYAVTAPPSLEDAETETNFPTSEGVFVFNVSNDEFEWNLTNEVSAFGEGGTAFVFDNYNDINGVNPGGTIDALITRHFDFSAMNDPILKFDVAYAPYIEDVGDSLLVLIATNCSQNFNQIVYRNGGMALSTAPIISTLFTPTSTQWRTETVDLSAFAGMSDVTIALLNKSSFGNRLFIDNIGVGRNCNGIATSITNVTPDDCFVGCNGSATIQVSNANGALQYEWAGFPNLNGPTNSQLCSGTTNVTVTDAIGCSKEIEVQITGQQPAVLTITSTNVITYNGNDGSATVNTTNGIAPYSYIWNHGFQQSNVTSTSSTASNLSPGDYSVTVINGNGCTSTATVTVGSICNGFGISSTPNMPSCFGGNNGSIAASAIAGTLPLSYLWSNGQTASTAINLTAGNYSVTVTDANGCPATSQTTLQQPTQLLLNTTASPQTLNGVNNGSASVVASGGTIGYTYLWSNGGTSATINNLAPATYTVTVTDANNCSTTASATVNSVSCASLAGSLNIGNLACFGAMDGTASPVVNGGSTPYTYSWSNGSTASQLSGLTAGPIAVSITDDIGCVLSLSGNVTQPQQLQANSSSTQETLAGANNGTATVAPSGGVSPYQVTWSTGATMNTISGLAPGIYNYTITDANNCTVNGQVPVTTSTCFISLEMGSTPTSCPDLANGSATATVLIGGTGTLSYLWSNGGTTSTIGQLTSGSYDVTVSDPTGCSATGQVNVTSADATPPTLTLYDSPEISIDEDGVLELEPSMLVEAASDNCSMVFYEISPSQVDCSDIGTVEVTVKATDSSGNLTTMTTTVQVFDLISPVVTCPNNIAQANCAPIIYALPTATDNCSSSFTFELELGPESGAIFPVGETTVVWSATDESGNKGTCAFQVLVISTLSVQTNGNDISCFGYNDGSIDVAVSGGQAPYSVIPSNLAQLPAGTYQITVTDFSGCSQLSTVTISQPDELALVVSNTTPATIGQSNGIIEYEVLGGTAPVSLTWLQGGSILPNFNPTAAPAGMYQVRLEDANGCIYLSGLIAVGSVSSTRTQDLERRIQLFPNPSTGLVYFQTDLPISEPINLDIFDGAGRFLLRNAMTAPANTIDLQSYDSGVYWVKVQMGEAVVWKRLVKI